MPVFSSVDDVVDLPALVQRALDLKREPFSHQKTGHNKTIGLIFLNPSLRTRMSTQKAAANLGMNVMVLNMDKDGWALEMRDGVAMNGSTVEHIREAAAVMGGYCDILGLRSFPSLKNREEDYAETIFRKFMLYCGKPVVSLESATRHPLQSLADLITIEELKKTARPKVVLSWAPHVKALPQAVPNSFAEWMNRADVDFVITNPEGYDLAPEFAGKAPVLHDQDEAMDGADFIYVKNWSAYAPYGSMPAVQADWMLTNRRLASTRSAKIMHCLPVRRDLELAAEVLDGPHSAVLQQAANREWAAQAVLLDLLERA
ncbi:MAG: acetylornithine carbamoyltransferase [Mucilaginibacter polytrichastri]|nr:acetylornithine carbamoyltransferase [Mucilaginibacter polytrichastri]